MKSLLDIQQDIRSLESNISAISENIKNIYKDIATLRNTGQNNDIDYTLISSLAKHFPFGEHPLAKHEDREISKAYLIILLNIIRLDFEMEKSVNGLIFVQWIQAQANIELSLEELVIDCNKTTTNSHYKMVDKISNGIRNLLIVDSLITANIGGTANQIVLEYVAGLGSVLGISKEEFRSLSQVAYLVLKQDFKGIKGRELSTVIENMKRSYFVMTTPFGKELSTVIKNMNPFVFYLYEKDVKEPFLIGLRTIVLKVKDSDVNNFKWIVEQMQQVEKGDVIAVLNDGYLHRVQKRTSPLSGTLFQFRDNNTNYGVVAHESDNKDSIKEWVKSRR